MVKEFIKKTGCRAPSYTETCPVSLMDKTMDSGSINMGSIPIRDAIY